MDIIKKILLLLGGLVLLGGLGFSGYKYYQLSTEYKQLTKDYDAMKQKLDNIGDVTEAYRLKLNVKKGEHVRAEDFEPVYVPVSIINEDTMLNVDSLQDYYRVDIKKGTLMANSLTMGEKYKGAVYERDIALDSVPVGLKKGDYVDIRAVLPTGDEFVVVPRKRVDFRLNNNIKVKLDEKEIHQYTALLTDKSMYNTKGFKVYAVAYANPENTDKELRTLPYYPVRNEAIPLVKANHNLTQEDKEEMINVSLRNHIEQKLAFYNQDENEMSERVSSGVSEEHQAINSTNDEYNQLVGNTTGLSEEGTDNSGDTGVQEDTSNEIEVEP